MTTEFSDDFMERGRVIARDGLENARGAIELASKMLRRLPMYHRIRIGLFIGNVTFVAVSIFIGSWAGIINLACAAFMFHGIARRAREQQWWEESLAYWIDNEERWEQSLIEWTTKEEGT